MTQPKTPPEFFDGPEALRRWLAEHGADAPELHIGFIKAGTGRANLSWPQSVDEALCAGWIDGVRHRIDDEYYRIRFTPRKPSSHWSAINIARIAELREQGRMTPAGEAAFAARSEERSARMPHEQKDEHIAFGQAELKALRADKAAWRYFEAAPPGYQRVAIWRVMSAKRPETRERRLADLIAACADGRRLEAARSKT